MNGWQYAGLLAVLIIGQHNLAKNITMILRELHGVQELLKQINYYGSKR